MATCITLARLENKSVGRPDRTMLISPCAVTAATDCWAHSTDLGGTFKSCSWAAEAVGDTVGSKGSNASHQYRLPISQSRFGSSRTQLGPFLLVPPSLTVRRAWTRLFLEGATLALRRTNICREPCSCTQLDWRMLDTGLAIPGL